MKDLWAHPWGRVFVIALTVATVSWALRATAIVTWPVVAAAGDVLIPLAIGFTIAYVLNPMVDGLQRTGMPRAVAATILYLLSVLVGVLALSLVLPTVIRQSSDLATRTFQAQPFLDLDRDGKLGPEEEVVVPLADQPGRYFADRDGDAAFDDGEPVYDEDRHLIAEAPSLVGYVLGWLEQQQGHVERFVGLDLSANDLAFLQLYAEQTAEVRAILNDGVEAARDGLPFEQWRAELQVEPARLPKLPGGWAYCWPGVTTADFEAAAVAVGATDAERWRAVMGWYGRLYTAWHERLVRSYDLARGAARSERDSGSVSQGNVDAGGELVVDETLEPAERERLVALEQQMREAERQRYEPVLALLRALDAADPVSLAEQLQQRWSSTATGAADQELDSLVAAIQEGEEAGAAYAVALLDRVGGRKEAPGSVVLRDMVDNLGDQLRGGLTSASGRVADGVTALVTNIGGLFGLALDVVLVPIYAFFLTLVMPGIRRTVKRYVPERGRDTIIRLAREIERVVAAFFRGRLIVCFICAVLVWIGFAILGVPYAGLFGILIGLATTIPLSGLIFLVPACLLTVVEGGDSVVLRTSMIIAIYTIVQTLEMTVFTPTIMGREVELHPVTLILALIFFGKLIGILGLILAVPIAATIRIIAREFVLPRLRGMASLPADSRMWSKDQLGSSITPPGVQVSQDPDASPAQTDAGEKPEAN